jgi:ABC-2 type transport system permease protein
MTTATDTHQSTAAPAGRRPTYKVTQSRVLRSEWAKFWSVRSTWITLALALIALIGFGTIAAFRYKSMIGGGRHIDRDFLNATSVSLTLFGVNFGQLALGVLGVLFAAGEYTTGSIRSTLTAVPKRLPVLWSKVVVYGVVAFVVGTIGAFAGFLVTNTVVSGTPAHLSLSGDQVVRSLLGAGLYLGLIGVITAALGGILRSVAGGISAFIAVIMLIPGLLSLLPTSWQSHVGPYLPSNAGEAIYTLHQHSDLLTPGKGALVLLGWTVLAVAGAAWRLVSRDA